MLCCVVLTRVLSCRVVLYLVMLSFCYFELSCVGFCCVCRVGFCCVVSCWIILCSVVFCRVVYVFVVFCSVLLCFVVLWSCKSLRLHSRWQASDWLSTGNWWNYTDMRNWSTGRQAWSSPTLCTTNLTVYCVWTRPSAVTGRWLQLMHGTIGCCQYVSFVCSFDLSLVTDSHIQ